MPAVSEPYYDVTYKDYEGNIQKERIEADNIFISKDFKSMSFTLYGRTVRMLTEVFEARYNGEV